MALVIMKTFDFSGMDRDLDQSIIHGSSQEHYSEVQTSLGYLGRYLGCAIVAFLGGRYTRTVTPDAWQIPTT